MKSLADRVEALERTALRHDKAVEEHNKQIKVIRDLIREGMRIVTRNAVEQRQLRASVKELVNSLKRGSNGHSKRKLDIQ
jgi:hypothetical protein